MIGRATTPKPPVQEIFSPAARVICRKPSASSSRARLKRAGVDGAQTTGGDDAGQQRLGVRVVAGDEHGGRHLADGAGRQGGREVGVERLEHARLRQRGSDLGGGRAVGGDGQRVEGLEVQRVGDVDDDLAGELVGALGEDVGHGRVGDGENDDVAGDRLVGVGLVEHLDGVAALGDEPEMAWPMLPVPMMLTCAMGCSWVGS